MTKNTEKSNKTNLDLIDEDVVCAEIMKQHPSIYNDLLYDEYNIKEKLEKNPYQYQQFRMLWLSEKHKLRKIEILRDEYVGKLYDRLRYEGSKTLSKVEIERYYIPIDPKVMEFNRLYMKQEMRVDVYGYIAEAFKTQGFTMATYVKNLQI
jgi:hypothetical protein